MISVSVIAPVTSRTVREATRQPVRIASVALMDSKSIAATAFNGGYLTSAENCPVVFETLSYEFNEHIYENIVYNGFGKAKPETEIVYNRIHQGLAGDGAVKRKSVITGSQRNP